MKIAVTGHRGQIGSRMIGFGYPPIDMELTEPLSIHREIQRVKPDVILHCAGISSIDACENNYEVAIDVNFIGTRSLCREAEDVGAKVVLLSSDYVFDGEEGNYAEDSEPKPINNYGFTKFGAEAIVQSFEGKIIRMSRTFNFNSPDIHEYMKKLVSGEEIFVPDFLYRNYCNTDLMCSSLDYYLQHFEDMPEILHIAGADTLSYHEFIKRIAWSFFSGFQERIKPRGDDNSFAKRPKKCGLNVNLARSIGVPIWTLDESIERMKNE